MLNKPVHDRVSTVRIIFTNRHEIK